MIAQGRGIFAPHFPVYMQSSNMHQARDVSQILNETTDLGTTFSPRNDFSEQLLIWIAKFLRYCRSDIDLERGVNVNDGVIPDSRPALPDGQFN